MKQQIGQSCIDGECACVHDPRVGKKAVVGLKDSQKALAMSEGHKWKMSKTFNEIAPEELRLCGSCGFKESDFTNEMTMGFKKSLKNPELVKFQNKIHRKPVEWKKVMYLNMDGAASERRQDTLLQDLPKWSQGIPFERFKACGRGCAEHSEDLAKFAPKGLGPYVAGLSKKGKWGTVGVFLSHAQVLEKIHKDDPEGEGLYVVMEDDAKLQNNGWKQHVEELIQKDKLPEDWDILKIGYWGDVRCEDFINDEVIEARAPGVTEDGENSFYSGNVAYIVRPKSVPAILEQLRSSQLYDVDGAMMSLHTEGVSKDVNGLNHHWTWGSHTYATAKPLVFGGLGQDTLRLLQTSEAVSVNAEVEEGEHGFSREFGAVQMELNPWIDWGSFGTEKASSPTSDIVSPTSTSVRKALLGVKDLRLGQQHGSKTLLDAGKAVLNAAQEMEKQGMDRAHQLGHSMHKVGRMNKGRAKKNQQKNKKM